MPISPALPEDDFVPCFGGPLDGRRLLCDRGAKKLIRHESGFYRLDPQRINKKLRWVYRWSER